MGMFEENMSRLGEIEGDIRCRKHSYREHGDMELEDISYPS